MNNNTVSMEANSEIGPTPKDTSREDDAGAAFVLESKGTMKLHFCSIFLCLCLCLVCILMCL